MSEFPVTGHVQAEDGMKQVSQTLSVTFLHKVEARQWSHLQLFLENVNSTESVV